jgi:hypothetical protein
VKPQLIIFIRSPENEQGIWKNDRCWGLYKIGFVQGPQKLNNGSGRTIHHGMVDWGFALPTAWIHQNIPLPTVPLSFF